MERFLVSLLWDKLNIKTLLRQKSTLVPVAFGLAGRKLQVANAPQMSPAESGAGGLRVFSARLEQHRINELMTGWFRLKGTTGIHPEPPPCSGIPWSHWGLCPASLEKENPQPRSRTRQRICYRFLRISVPETCPVQIPLVLTSTFLPFLELWGYKRTLAPVDETFTTQTGRVWNVLSPFPAGFTFIHLQSLQGLGLWGRGRAHSCTPNQCHFSWGNFRGAHTVIWG